MKLLLPSLLLLIYLLSCSDTSLYDVELKGLSGEEVSLRKYKGRKLILYVWSGTCVGHAEDMKRLNDILPTLGEGTALVSIAIMMEPEDIKKVLEENGIKPKYPIYADLRGELGSVITLLYLPATLFIEGEGEVVGNYPRLPYNLFREGSRARSGHGQ